MTITLEIGLPVLIGFAVWICYCIKNGFLCKFYSRMEKTTMELKTIGDTDFVSVREAARYLGVSIGSVHNAIHSGTLMAINLGHNNEGKRARWRLRKEYLDKFLEDGKNIQL